MNGMGVFVAHIHHGWNILVHSLSTSLGATVTRDLSFFLGELVIVSQLFTRDYPVMVGVGNRINSRKNSC